MRFIFAALAITALAGCATVKNMPPLVVEAAVSAPGHDQRELCGRARDWAAFSFADSKAVVEVYEPDRGRMIGKGTFTLIGFGGTPFYVDYTFAVDCKAALLSYRFQDYSVRSNGPGVYPLKEDSLNKIYSRTKSQTIALGGSLARAVTDGVTFAAPGGSPAP